MNRLFVSVDADEWYLSRWAIGARKSKWKSLDSLSQDVYQSPNPIGEMAEPFNKLLDMFDELDFKSTFFLLA